MKERNVFFNDAVNTFYLASAIMVKDHSETRHMD